MVLAGGTEELDLPLNVKRLRVDPLDGVFLAARTSFPSLRSRQARLDLFKKRRHEVFRQLIRRRFLLLG
jgi:hypothetical protein